MTLLASLLPMLTDGASFQLLISRQGDALQVVTVPKIAGFKPDTTDPELAAIQAALVQPLVFNIAAGADPDAELARLISQAAEIRRPAVDQLAAYQEAQRQSQQAARAAQEKKAASKTSAPAKPAKAVTASTTSPDDDEPGIPLDGHVARPSAASAPVVTPAAPAPATINLF